MAACAIFRMPLCTLLKQGFFINIAVHPAKDTHIRLADFIHQNQQLIIDEWENFAETMTPAATDMTPLALRDHIKEILLFIADDMETPQSTTEQIKKSQGEKAKVGGHTAAETHAALRLAGGFNLDQMVSEFRALRASVIHQWGAATAAPTCKDIVDLTRFNESVDQQLAESVSYYTKRVNYSKDLFLGILSHDMRSPLSAALISAQLLAKIGPLNERQTMLDAQIVDCMTRAIELVTNLFDLTRARFGSGLPVMREAMDMGFVSRKLVQEMRMAYTDNTINLDISGNMQGKWDKARIGQIFTNLIGNAVHYGFQGRPITVTLQGSAADVTLSVHNEGIPIPDEIVERIFASLTRGGEYDDPNETESTHMGLGLYITKEIVTAHGGTITVASSDKTGTTFTVRLPNA